MGACLGLESGASGQRLLMEAVSFRGDESALQLIVAMVKQFCEYTQNHWVVYFKWGNCAVCELKLPKAVIFSLRLQSENLKKKKKGGRGGELGGDPG